MSTQTTAGVAGRSLTTGQAIGLVAKREVRTRLRSKSFLATTAAFVVLILLGGGLFAWMGSSDPSRVGVVPEAQSLSSSVEAVAAASGSEVEVVDVADRETGAELVRDGDLDVLVLAPDDGIGVLVESELPLSLSGVFSALAQQEALAAEIVDLGGDPAQVGATLATAVPRVEALDEVAERDGAQIVAGFLAGILIFVALMTTGQMVAQGVVEEKSSRVVELLLATVRPWQLMAGKVIGIGIVGLVQVLAIVAAAVGGGLGFGLVDASALQVGPTALWALFWFALGYVTYAVAMAGLAALVSRQEDVGSAVGPVMTVLMVPYIIGVTIAPWDPGNPLVVWLSYVPFCAPMLMPMRIALGTVETWEILVAVGLSVAILPVLIWLAGRLYGRGLLRTGARMKVLAALRS